MLHINTANSTTYTKDSGHLADFRSYTNGHESRHMPLVMIENPNPTENEKVYKNPKICQTLFVQKCFLASCFGFKEGLMTPATVHDVPEHSEKQM